MDHGLDCHSVDCVPGVLACLSFFVFVLLWRKVGGKCLSSCTIISDVRAGLVCCLALGRGECVHVSSCQEFVLIPLVNLYDVSYNQMKRYQEYLL